MEDREMFSSSKVRRTWQDFLEHMCRPSASYFIQSIKSFIVSSSNNPPDAEKDSDAVMFFPDLEADFQAHTLLDGCSEKELEIAGEGLERYVMTKLYSRVLATVPDDVNEQLSEKMALIQQFIELSVWRFRRVIRGCFVVASSNKLPNPERDSGAVQQFFQYMESAFRGHPLWAGCSEEELESAGEGLEKYVMIKLYDRLFASAPDDVKADEQLYEKMALVQQFIRPENLDIKSTCQNGSSWLLAQEELQKINMYKAPRKKLASILNCCKVITNLLHNAAMTANQDTPGADEFFPVLIYVILKANPPQLHSNLQYIQRYRSQSRMVSETAYYFTNILSAVAFISSIGAESLSVNKMEFDRNMDSARAVLYRATSKAENADAESVASSKSLEHTGLPQTSPYPSATCSVRQNNLLLKDASAISEENDPNDVFQEFPYVCYSGEDLSVGDIECLRNNYNKLVFKYACLANGLSVTPSPPVLSIQQPLAHQPVETIEEPESTKDGTRAIKRQPDQGPF